MKTNDVNRIINATEDALTFRPDGVERMRVSGDTVVWYDNDGNETIRITGNDIISSPGTVSPSIKINVVDLWQEAVISEAVCCHIYNETHVNNPRKVLQDIISWHVQVALDPQVSSDAQALIDRGAAAEREAMLDLVDDYAKSNDDLRDAIRARNNT